MLINDMIINLPVLNLEESTISLLMLQEELLKQREEIISFAISLDNNNIINLDSKYCATKILRAIGLTRNSSDYIIKKILRLDEEDTSEMFIDKFNKLNIFLEILIENIKIFVEYINGDNSIYIDFNIMQHVSQILPNEQNAGLYEIIRNFLMIAIDYNNNININTIIPFTDNVNNAMNDNIINFIINDYNYNIFYINKNKNNLEQPAIFINGMEITAAVFAALKDAYIGVNGHYFDNDNDFLILSDIIQAVNLIYNGKIEYDFDGIVYTQKFVQLKGTYKGIEREEQIDNSLDGKSSAKKFVEEQINSGTLEGIIKKLQESEQPDIKNSGDILNLILINKVKKLPSSLRRRYSW